MSQSQPPAIVFCNDTMVEFYEQEVEVVVEALLGHTQAFVSDESSVWDFCPDEDAMSRLNRLLGRSVGDEDATIWQLARELRFLNMDGDMHPPRTNH